MILRKVDKKGLILWLLLSLVMTLVAYNATPLMVVESLFLAANMAAFIVMLIDKNQAIHGGRRLSERSLFLIALLGGSPGVVTGVYLLRHKSRKLSFKLILFSLVFLQVALIYLFYTDWAIVTKL